MVRRRQRNSRRPRRRNNNMARQIGQIQNSQSTIKRSRGPTNDPPPVNLSLKHSRRLRYSIYMQRANSGGSWEIIPPASTTSSGLIRRLVPISGIPSYENVSVTFSLAELAKDFRDYMFGNAPSQICEFAVQSVELFGPVAPYCNTVTLRMDFSSEKAATLARDVPGSTSRRAYVGIRPTQLTWFNESSAGANACAVNIGGIAWDADIFPNSLDAIWNVGYLDFVFTGVCGPTVLDTPTSIAMRQDAMF